MNDDVKAKRQYNSPHRSAQAAATRSAILDAARQLFAEKGYPAATIGEIAARSGVAVDTVYATVGRKPALMRVLVETALSGSDDVIPAHERDYVGRVEAADSAAAKIEIYADALAGIQPRLAPVFLSLREAAITDADCAGLWGEISERRARNMLDFAASLRRTGDARADLSDQQIADVVWSMNAPEYWDLLVRQRQWTPAQFATWLIDAWSRLLLAPRVG